MACEDVDPDIDPKGTLDPALVERAKAIVTAWYNGCATLSDWDDVVALDDLSRRIAIALSAAPRPLPPPLHLDLTGIEHMKGTPKRMTEHQAMVDRITDKTMQALPDRGSVVEAVRAGVARAADIAAQRLWVLAMKFDTCAVEADSMGFSQMAEIFRMAAGECRKALS